MSTTIRRSSRVSAKAAAKVIAKAVVKAPITLGVLPALNSSDTNMSDIAIHMEEFMALIKIQKESRKIADFQEAQRNCRNYIENHLYLFDYLDEDMVWKIHASMAEVVCTGEMRAALRRAFNRVNSQ